MRPLQSQTNLLLVCELRRKLVPVLNICYGFSAMSPKLQGEYIVTRLAQSRVRVVVDHLIHSMVYGKAMTLLIAYVCAPIVGVNELDGLYLMLLANCLKDLLRNCPAWHDITIYVPSQLGATANATRHTIRSA